MKKFILVLLCLIILIMGAACNSNNSVETNCKHDDPTQIVSVEAKAATCRESGLTAGMKCNLCGTFVTPQTAIPSIDCIESDWIVDKEPTHQEEGARHTECTMCKKIFKQETLGAGSYGLAFAENDDGTYTVTGIGDCTDSEIMIPKTHNGKAVTNIGDLAFDRRSNLTSITIPDSVTSIGANAFMYCTSLTSITIPDSVTSIDHGAFMCCSSLATITIPDSVTYISYDVFAWCSSLTSVSIPNGVTYIGTFSFVNCENLSNIIIPNSVTVIWDRAFEGCRSLTNITIPDSVTSIGAYAFKDCSRLESITIPAGVTTISQSAFEDCISLASITISDSVASIGGSAFFDCKNLSTIIFNGTVNQWEAIEKYPGWNVNTGDYVIHCTDGDIAK